MVVVTVRSAGRWVVAGWLEEASGEVVPKAKDEARDEPASEMRCSDQSILNFVKKI